MGILCIMRATPNKVYVVAVVAQLVEPRIVIPVVAGSSPVNRPTISKYPQ
jgi:hypothetical protein